MMKYCYKCGESKPLGAFHKDSSRKDGRQNKCHQCQLDINNEHRRKKREEQERKEREEYLLQVYYRSEKYGKNYTPAPENPGLYASDNPKLLELRDIWYKKLEESGFIDHEQHKKGCHFDFPFLNKHTYEIAQRVREAQEQGIDEYFRVTAQYLHYGTFKSRRERILWEMHVEGWSFSQISAELKRRRWVNTSRFWVHKQIRRIRRRMLQGDSWATDRYDIPEDEQD